jgi:hypothetical protein
MIDAASRYPAWGLPKMPFLLVYYDENYSC